MREQDVQHVLSAQVALTTEHALHTVVVLTSAEHEFTGLRIDAPAGKGARRLFDVLLGVVPFPQREELHHLAREVLVRLCLAIGGAVEIDDHRRVSRDCVEQRPEAAQRMLPQEAVLAIHELRRAHLLLGGDEVVVPEQRHPLGERRGCDAHLLDPPAFQLQRFFAPLALQRQSLLGCHVPDASQRLERFLGPLRRCRDALFAGGLEQPLDGLFPCEPRERSISAGDAPKPVRLSR